MFIFDFDGVLMDSLDEVAVTAYNASKLVDEETLADLAFKVEYPGSSFIKIFRTYRYIVQPAGEFIPFARLCKAHLDGTTSLSTENIEENFSHFQNKELLSLEHLTELFFKTRNLIVSDNPIGWIEMNNPYWAIWNALKEIPVQRRVLLTNKNLSAVQSLAKHFGLQLLDNNIYSGDKGRTKITNLKQLDQDFSERSYSFIDDSVKNLLDIKNSLGSSLPLKLYLASWGYIGPKSIELATASNIEVLSQDILLDMLKGGCYK